MWWQDLLKYFAGATVVTGGAAAVLKYWVDFLMQRDQQNAATAAEQHKAELQAVAARRAADLQVLAHMAQVRNGSWIERQTNAVADLYEQLVEVETMLRALPAGSLFEQSIAGATAEQIRKLAKDAKKARIWLDRETNMVLAEVTPALTSVFVSATGSAMAKGGAGGAEASTRKAYERLEDAIVRVEQQFRALLAPGSSA